MGAGCSQTIKLIERDPLSALALFPPPPPPPPLSSSPPLPPTSLVVAADEAGRSWEGRCAFVVALRRLDSLSPPLPLIPLTPPSPPPPPPTSVHPMSAALTPPTTPTTTHMYSVQAKPVHVNSGAAAPSKPYEASRMSRWVLPCRHSLLERVPMSNTANSTTD